MTTLKRQTHFDNTISGLEFPQIKFDNYHDYRARPRALIHIYAITGLPVFNVGNLSRSHLANV